MHSLDFKKQLRQFVRSEKALAVPLTYLILFASLITIISATYGFAITNINGKGALLKIAVAKQNMQFLDASISSIAWSPQASAVTYMDDCGAIFRAQPSAKNLRLNFTDERSFSDLVFNSSIGKLSYIFEVSEASDEGLFIRGDGQTIVNRSSAVMSQLHITTEDGQKELVLCYRPLATTAVVGTSGEKPLNLIRVYVISFNTTTNFALSGRFYLRALAQNVRTFTHRYESNQSISRIAVEAASDDASDKVWLTVSSNELGTVVDLEIIVCNVEIRRVEA